MLDVKVHHGYHGRKENGCYTLPPLDSNPVRWAEHNASKRPWQRRDEIGDHEYIVPIVVVRRRDIGPSAAHHGPKQANGRENLGKVGTRAARQEIP